MLKNVFVIKCLQMVGTTAIVFVSDAEIYRGCQKGNG